MLLFTVFRSPPLWPLCHLPSCPFPGDDIPASSITPNNNFIKVTMVFIREIHFSTLVQKLLRIYVRPERSAVRTSNRRLGHRWAEQLMCYFTAAVVPANVMPRCLVIRVAGSMRYTKYFYRSTLCCGRICYGPVSVSYTHLTLPTTPYV